MSEGGVVNNPGGCIKLDVTALPLIILVFYLVFSYSRVGVYKQPTID